MTPSEDTQLIELLGRQFTAIDCRFERIDGRFAAIDGRFEAIDRRFDAIDRPEPVNSNETVGWRVSWRSASSVARGLGD